MATIEKKDNGTWRVRYRDPGAPNPKSITCPDEKSAKVVQGAIERHQVMNPGKPYPRNGEDGPKPPADAVAAAEAWLADLGRTHAPATLRRMTSEIVQYLSTLGDGATLATVTSTSVEAFDTRCVAAEMAPESRRKMLGTIDNFRLWIAERPEEWPGLPPLRRVKRPKSPPPAVVAPRWDEIDAMLAQLRKGSAPYRLARVARDTGLRLGQVCAIQWTDVDLDGGTLRVMTGKSDQEAAARRVIPLPAALVAEMRTWDRDPSGRMVGRGRKDKLSETVGRAWARAAKEGKARPEVFAASEKTGRRRGCAVHGLRKGLTSNMKRARVDDEAVEVYLGHATGIRGRYVDPEALGLPDVAAAVPAPGTAPKPPPKKPTPPEGYTAEEADSVNNVLHFLAMASKQTR